MEKSLREFDSVKEFLSTLEDYGMQREAGKLEVIIDYVDQTQRRYDEMNEEMQKIKEQLNSVQNLETKQELSKITNDISNNIAEERKGVLAVKENTAKTLAKGIESAKTLGKDALTGTLKIIKASSILNTLSKGLKSVSEKADHAIDKLTKIADSAFEAKGHLKNFGRAITGKESDEIGKRDTDSGMCIKIQEKLFKVMETGTKMANKIDKSVEALNYREEEMADRHSDIKENISDRIASAKEKMKEQVKNKNERNVGLEAR